MNRQTSPARTAAAVFALAAAFVGANALRADDSGSADGVKLETLTWKDFSARLGKAGSQGYKYTLVDAWATTCGPCKENFPHLVEMNQKYGRRGGQVVSLSLDDSTDKKAVEAAKVFLREKKATFLNVLLDEEFGVGFEKLDINAIPAVFVFGPDGKLVKKYTLDDPKNQFTYEDVEKDVAALVSGKDLGSR